jgi:hypothetical protein
MDGFNFFDINVEDTDLQARIRREAKDAQHTT